MDYFQSGNMWASPEEREKARKREEELHQSRHSRRSNNRLTFDFAGRRVIAAAETNIDDEEELIFGMHTTPL